MVIQGNSFAYRQIDIQTVMSQIFRQKFQILHSKKIIQKSEKIDMYTVKRCATK